MRLPAQTAVRRLPTSAQGPQTAADAVPAQTEIRNALSPWGSRRWCKGLSEGNIQEPSRGLMHAR